jgi:hypothetical protein
MIPIIIVYVLQCCMFYAFDTLPGPCSVKSPELARVEITANAD